MSGILKFFRPLSSENIHETLGKSQLKQTLKTSQDNVIKKQKEILVTNEKPTKKRGRKPKNKSNNQEPEKEVEPIDEIQEQKEQDKVNVTLSEMVGKDEEEEKEEKEEKEEEEEKEEKHLPNFEVEAKTDHHHSFDPEVSSYELKRQQKMAQNAAFLKNLGIKTLQSIENSKPKTKPKLKKASIKRQAIYTTGSLRRSKRVKEAIENEVLSVEFEANKQLEQEKKKLEMIEKSFTKSVVYDYVCDRRCTTTSFSTTKAFHSAIDHLPDNLLQQNEKPLLTQFYFDDDCSELYDRSLSNIYSVSFSPNFQKRLVVAGGDKGKVCVFPKETTPQQQQEDKDKEKEEQNEPLMSFHAHKGWISSVSLELSQSGRNLLLTSSNDATIKLWDLNEYSELTKTPKEIFHHQIHSSGIFSMHVQKKTLLIATGSKDTHVNISKLREDSSSSQIVRRYEDNTNVVKQVQWRDINCLGATGNDRNIRIYDIRSNENKASICIEDAHTQAINSLRWHPTNEYFLLSTAFDTCMHLFDIRKPKEPYNTIEEHMKDRKYTGIYHPCFLQGGDVIATGSTGTKAIMLFNTMDGGMISCGLLNNINAIYPDPYDSKVLVTTGRSMLYLKPFYDKYRHIRGVDDPVDYYNGYLSPKLMKEILNKGQ